MPVLAAAAVFGLPALTLQAYATNTTYYVDCSQSAAGNGTSASPWNSTSAVNARSGFGSGDVIAFKTGTTCHGALNPKGSGASGSPITVTSYGTGSTPTIQAASGQDHAIELSNQSYWTIKNLNVVGGTRYGVFVTVTTGVVNGITLKGLTVSGVTGGTLDDKATGLVVVVPTTDSTNSTSARFNNVLVDHVLAHDTTMWAGIIVGSASNTSATTLSKRSTNMTVQYSSVYNTYGDGIIAFADTNATLQNNTVHNSGEQPTKTIGTPNALWTWACNNCVVQYNEVWNNTSPGVDGGGYDIDYFSTNTTVQYNYAHDNAGYCVAVFGADNYTNAGNYIRYNVCANNGVKKNSPQIETYTWNGGHLNTVQIYNNTIVGSQPAFQSTSASYNGGTNFFKNNLIYSSNSKPDSLYSGMSGTSDYNLWFTTAGAYNNGEPHSVYKNPQLVNPGYTGNAPLGSNFTLQSTSPAIDAGTTISGAGTRDYYGNPIPRGNAIDIGANESPYT